MKLRILLLIIIALFLYGCDMKKKEDETKVPIETKKAEMKDSTRLDPAEDTSGN